MPVTPPLRDLPNIRDTIAERVESIEVLQELGRLGIGFALGFYIAEPRPAIEFP